MTLQRPFVYKKRGGSTTEDNTENMTATLLTLWLILSRFVRRQPSHIPVASVILHINTAYPRCTVLKHTSFNRARGKKVYHA